MTEEVTFLKEKSSILASLLEVNGHSIHIQIPSFEESKEPNPSIKTESLWLAGEDITNALQKINPGMVILSKYHEASVGGLVEVDSEKLLECILSKMLQDGEFTKGVLPIKVNAITKTLNTITSGQQTSHWVGICIEKTDSTYFIKYIDPMGHPISQQVSNLLKSILQVDVTQPFNGTGDKYIEDIKDKTSLKLTKKMQYVKYKDDIQFIEKANQKIVVCL